MAENKITSSESSTVPKNEGSTVDKKKTSGKVTVDPKEQAVTQDAPATQTETAKNEVPEKKDAGKMRDEMKESVKKEPAKQARAESKNTAETVVVKKGGGTGLALLALLVALGLGMRQVITLVYNKWIIFNINSAPLNSKQPISHPQKWTFRRLSKSVSKLPN